MAVEIGVSEPESLLRARSAQRVGIEPEAIAHLRIARRALLGMTAREQRGEYRAKDMSQVMWDMFTGSAPYREVVARTLHPRFLARLSWEFVRSGVAVEGGTA